MSFTSKVKEELCNVFNSRLENIAEIKAIIQNNSFSDHIKIITENKEVAKRIYKIIKELYDINCKITLRKRFNFDKSTSYILEIRKNFNFIMEDLSLSFHNLILEDDEEKRAYLRGLFLSSGSINDPNSSTYHLEFLIKDKEYSQLICNLLNEYYLNSKIITRSNGYMVYIKEAEKIADFLRVIKAFNSLMDYENVRIIKDNSNRINRINNCSQANLDKVFQTAYDQINDINLISENLTLDILDEKTKIAAIYRLKYKESSLLELSNIISLETEKKISKSGLNHRFRKIKEIANQIRSSKN